MKVEGNLPKTTAITGKLRHVSGLSPPLFRLPDLRITAVVVEVRVEAATRHDDLDPIVKDSRVDRVMPAQRVADRAIGPRLDEQERVQQVETGMLSQTALSVPLSQPSALRSG